MAEESENDELVPVNVIALLEEPSTSSPVVILHDPDQNRVLPIWIGEPEARAISVAFQNVKMERPLTHTLLSNVIMELEAKLLRVVIVKIDGGTYYAQLELENVHEEFVTVDSRPSDSIALALEVGAPIFVMQSILDVAAQDNPFPSGQTVQEKAKQEFSKEELEDLKSLLEKAREREQGGGSDE